MARGRLAERRKAPQRYFRRRRQHEIIYQTAKALSSSTFKKISATAHKTERNFEANIETADSVKEKVKAAFGFDLRSALDLVKRSDYDTDEQYLDACARAELERSSPEYRAARSRLKVEYQARREEQERKAQSENYKAIRSSVSLDSVDKHNIDEEAAALARRDLSANRIAASDLGATIEKYAAELTEKAKDSKASSALFNAMLRGQL